MPSSVVGWRLAGVRSSDGYSSTALPLLEGGHRLGRPGSDRSRLTLLAEDAIVSVQHPSGVCCAYPTTIKIGLTRTRFIQVHHLRPGVMDGMSFPLMLRRPWRVGSRGWRPGGPIGAGPDAEDGERRPGYRGAADR